MEKKELLSEIDELERLVTFWADKHGKLRHELATAIEQRDSMQRSLRQECESSSKLRDIVHQLSDENTSLLASSSLPSASSASTL